MPDPVGASTNNSVDTPQTKHPGHLSEDAVESDLWNCIYRPGKFVGFRRSSKCRELSHTKVQVYSYDIVQNIVWFHICVAPTVKSDQGQNTKLIATTIISLISKKLPGDHRLLRWFIEVSALQRRSLEPETVVFGCVQWPIGLLTQSTWNLKTKKVGHFCYSKNVIYICLVA